uniref:Ribosomal protein S21 n=1 Tax=Peronospora matthiolae TaxID=2874970 RepID=A0AAV1TS33_9STRA
MMAALVRGCAARQPTAALASRTRILQQQQCFLWVKVQEGQDSSRVASRMQTILAEDGTLKTLALKRFHEKKWQKRKRKNEEQTIRRANRRVGSMIDFILRRKKAGY